MMKSQEMVYEPNVLNMILVLSSLINNHSNIILLSNHKLFVVLAKVDRA